MPKVSVIVPVYGVEKYIERCARSLFEQTLDDIEYIFVDDCTPDNSIDVLNHVLADYPQRKGQVKIHKMECNSGQAAVREWGIHHAKGDFVIHCDSDDWVEQNTYELLYEDAIKKDADAVVCDFNITDGSSVLRTIKGCFSTDKNIIIEQILFQTSSWSLWNKLFRRTTCYKDNIIYPHGNMGEDFLLTTQLLLNCSKIAYVPQPLYNYFFNTRSITRVETEEKKMANFRMNKDNADIVFGVLNGTCLNERYSQAIVSYKWYVKKLLWNTTFDAAKRKLWKKTYKEINSRILTNNHISVKDKVKFILTYLRLYPNN